MGVAVFIIHDIRVMFISKLAKTQVNQLTYELMNEGYVRVTMPK